MSFSAPRTCRINAAVLPSAAEPPNSFYALSFVIRVHFPAIKAILPTISIFCIPSSHSPAMRLTLMNQHVHSRFGSLQQASVTQLHDQVQRI